MSLLTAAAAATAPRATPTSNVPIGPMRALVVDDEPRLRQVLVRLMARDGFECADAANAEQGRRIEQLFLASMQLLADALEVKDPYTRGHSIRVSFYAVAIANTLGVD